MVKNGAIVDASVIDTPLKTKRKSSFEIAQDRAPEERRRGRTGKRGTLVLLINPRVGTKPNNAIQK